MGGLSVWVMLVDIPVHRDGRTAHSGCSAGRGMGQDCCCAEEIVGVPLLVRLLCTCPKKSKDLRRKRLRKQLVSSPPSSLQPSHSLALFSSSASSHKKTFHQLFFLTLYPRLPPIPSCLLFPFVFTSVVSNLCVGTFPIPSFSYFS